MGQLELIKSYMKLETQFEFKANMRQSVSTLQNRKPKLKHTIRVLNKFHKKLGSRPVAI